MSSLIFSDLMMSGVEVEKQVFRFAQDDKPKCEGRNW
jgi:hypothetical protein